MAGFGAVALALPRSAPAALEAVVLYQVFVNATILAFNLLPAFPLDGGREAGKLMAFPAVTVSITDVKRVLRALELGGQPAARPGSA